jgi:hypothetical protein
MRSLGMISINVLANMLPCLSIVRLLSSQPTSPVADTKPLFITKPVPSQIQPLHEDFEGIRVVFFQSALSLISFKKVALQTNLGLFIRRSLFWLHLWASELASLG